MNETTKKLPAQTINRNANPISLKWVEIKSAHNKKIKTGEQVNGVANVDFFIKLDDPQIA